MSMAQAADDINVHLNHNVYILGAGFGYDAGLPLLNTFLNEMRASVAWLSRQPNRGVELRAVKEVFRFRKEASSAALRVNLNIENIEDLFSLAAASGQYPLAQSVSTAIAATLDYSRGNAPSLFARVTVMHTFDPPDHWTVITPGPESATRRIPIYELYAGMLSGRFCVPDENMRNTVITFNYDTVLEDALTAIRVPYWYGFGPNAVAYETSNRSTVGFTDGALPLLKLHGSVNWAEPNGEDSRISVFGGYEDILATQRRVFLIPPTWRKVFTGALSNVWDEAVKALSEATRIIFVGFSMPPTDNHIKYLLAAGLQNNISLRKIHFFNPAPEVETNFYNVIKKDLKDQYMAEFNTLKTHHLVLGHNRQMLRTCHILKRPLSPEIARIDSEIPEPAY